MGQLRVWKMLYFEPAHIASLVSDISGASRSDFEFSQPVIPARRDHIDRFLNLYRGLTESRTELLAEERALLLFSQLLSERKSARPETYPIARARARIDDDPSVKVSLTDLAQETGLSRFQVVRGFAKQVGLTPHAYLVQRRLDTACSMVASGMRLADVAVACGFSDQSHFNRLFAKAYGLTPRSYAVAFRPPAISFKTS